MESFFFLYNNTLNCKSIITLDEYAFGTLHNEPWKFTWSWLSLIDLELGEGGIGKKRLNHAPTFGICFKEHKKRAFKREKSSLTSLKDICLTLYIADMQNA